MPSEPSSTDLSKLTIARGTVPGAGRSRRGWLWIVLVVAVVAGFVAWRFAPTRAVTVQTTPIVVTTLAQQYVVLNAAGYVVAQRKAAISSKATGRLEWLGVAEGSQVKAGEVIARIDSRDVLAQEASAQAAVRAARAALLQAEAELREAQLQLKRNEDLLAKAFVSQAVVDTAKWRADRAAAGVTNAQAAVAVAEANANAAHIAVDFTQIRAPFDGVILSKSANVGDLVTPFSSAVDSKGAVVTMADMGTLEVEADVSEASLSKIQVGQPCEILLDALPDTRFRGRIARMVPTVDRAKATVMTKVQFERIDRRVLPEMSAKVSFLSREVTPEEETSLLAVNAEAIATRGGRSVVFLVRDGSAVEVPVTTGAKIGALVAVKGDVRAGDKAIRQPSPELASGAPVATVAK